MRIIVCGSRSFADFDLLKHTLDRLTRKLDKGKLVILSGHAQGADRLGEQWAFERAINREVYHANWDKHGEAAGPIRNQEMVENAGALVAFWNGTSAGTKDVIIQARKHKLKVRVVLFEG